MAPMSTYEHKKLEFGNDGAMPLCHIEAGDQHQASRTELHLSRKASQVMTLLTVTELNCISLGSLQAVWWFKRNGS